MISQRERGLAGWHYKKLGDNSKGKAIAEDHGRLTDKNEALKFLKRLAEFGVEDASIIGGGEIGELPSKPDGSRGRSRLNQLSKPYPIEKNPGGDLVVEGFHRPSVTTGYCRRIRSVPLSTPETLPPSVPRDFLATRINKVCSELF